MRLIVSIDDNACTKDEFIHKLHSIYGDAVKSVEPLNEELHREKEQAYYLGYEDGRKAE